VWKCFEGLRIITSSTKLCGKRINPDIAPGVVDESVDPNTVESAEPKAQGQNSKGRDRARAG
jgi:hypothetical protein